ncbi:MAG: hypothetical protein IPL53_13160 [Ignavibacteria bacterium]|nr:hypothetical protein [Ignavibacteria bacterium]
MNKFYRPLFILFLLVLVLSQSKTNAQTIPPRFVMTVKNIATTKPTNPFRDSIVRFEVYLQQINQGQPNVMDFENCAGQFTWSYNKAIQAPGSNLFLNLFAAGTSLPAAIRPPAFQVDSINGYLKMAGNLPQSLVNYFISGTAPGTRILTAQLRTSANRFPSVPLNLRFKLGASPNTFVAAFAPYPDTAGFDSENFPNQTAIALMDTINPPGDPAYSVENGGFIFPPPPAGTPIAIFMQTRHSYIQGVQ